MTETDKLESLLRACGRLPHGSLTASLIAAAHEQLTELVAENEKFRFNESDILAECDALRFQNNIIRQELSKKLDDLKDSTIERFRAENDSLRKIEKAAREASKHGCCYCDAEHGQCDQCKLRAALGEKESK